MLHVRKECCSITTLLTVSIRYSKALNWTERFYLEKEEHTTNIKQFIFILCHPSDSFPINYSLSLSVILIIIVYRFASVLYDLRYSCFLFSNMFSCAFYVVFSSFPILCFGVVVCSKKAKKIMNKMQYKTMDLSRDNLNIGGKMYNVCAFRSVDFSQRACSRALWLQIERDSCAGYVKSFHLYIAGDFCVCIMTIYFIIPYFSG